MKKYNTTIDSVMMRLDKLISDANVELVKITEGGFPFAMEDVALTSECDSVGIYVHSGKTPVCAIVRAGNPDTVINALREKIREIIESTRAAVERRASLLDEANALQSEGEKTEKAVRALQDAGLDAVEILGKGIDDVSREAILAAVRKSVRAANRPTFLGIVKYKDWKLTVHDYIGGVVIKAGEKPVLVTRYPKVCSNKTIEQMVSWIEGDVAALSASRMRYFERVRLEADREEKLRSLAAQMDDTPSRMGAVM